APFALGTAYALRRRPTAGPQLWITAADGHLVEGGEFTGTVSVGNPDTVGYDVAVVRTRVSPWLLVERAGVGGARVDLSRSGVDRPFVTVVDTGTAVDLELAGKARRWGRHPIGPAGARVAAAGGMLVSRAAITEPVRFRVYPKTE
ncbi:DUF58 domain-containing protein, partial [Micromonospora sp. DH15]|nr:DUF58 domain-containing protein [Micromonospora sp. DH15]